MVLNLENVFYIVSLICSVAFVGAWYGATKKKLAEIEIDLKEVKNDKFEILAASSDVIPVNSTIQQIIKALGLLLLGWAAKDHTKQV